ncbi:MAG: hypothetical protein WD988_04075 [Candidatus Curtissbacteria bacterium]
MPFKTKKRKLKARSRNFVFSEGVVQIVDSNKNLAPKELAPKQISNAIEDYSYLKRDLLKIVLISGFILAGQIGLRLTLVK